MSPKALQPSQLPKPVRHRDTGTLTLAEGAEELGGMAVRLGLAIGEALNAIADRSAADRAERLAKRNE